MKKGMFIFMLKWVGKKIVNSRNELTPEYLRYSGWSMEEGTGLYYEPGTHSRDRLYIAFDDHNFYRVYQGKDRVFIAMECTQEWLDAYLMVIATAIVNYHPDFTPPPAPLPQVAQTHIKFTFKT